MATRAPENEGASEMTQHYVTEQDELNYGRELIDMTQRAAIQAVSPHLNALEQQNAALNRQLAIERRHRLDYEVEALVPDYREIDEDAAWHGYLRGIHPLTGQIRQRVLDDAINVGSASRVREFFEEFRRENHGSHGSHGPTDRGPARRGGRAPSSQGKPTYTRSQIDQFFRARQKGEYKNREAEAAQIEADIFAAQHEGRVLAHPYLTK
jgi:hypothetical protein